MLSSIGGVRVGRRLLGDGAADALDRFAVHLASPALLFADRRHPARFVRRRRVAFAVALASLVAPRTRHRADRAIEAPASDYPSTGFMGVPLVASVPGVSRRSVPPSCSDAIGSSARRSPGRHGSSPTNRCLTGRPCSVPSRLPSRARRSARCWPGALPRPPRSCSVFHLDGSDLRAAVLRLALPIGSGRFMPAKPGRPRR